MDNFPSSQPTGRNLNLTLATRPFLANLWLTDPPVKNQFRTN